MISLIDIKGLIRSKALGERWAASKLAGPEPIDLPKRRIDECGM